VWSASRTAKDFPDLGNVALDEEHEAMMRHIDDLRDAIAQRLPPSDQRFLLHELEVDLRNNCQSEEQMMQHDGFPDEQAHRQSHQALYRTLHRLEGVLLGGEIKATLEELRVVRETVENHILQEDARIANWHRVQNISPNSPD
jgi:hemerythrin-like metal-binding protein